MFKNYISSSYPAHIVMIIDQSSMMSEPYSKGKTKAEYVVDDINNFINQLIFYKRWNCQIIMNLIL